MSSVSVVVPFFNRSSFLERLISSILSQTLQPDQVFIVDNGSSMVEAERAWDVIRKFSADISFELIFVSTMKKGNANYARNLGLHLARAKYVAFLDSDDWWESFHLKKSRDFLLSSGKAAVYSGGIIHKESVFINYSADVNAFSSPLEFIFSKGRYLAQTSSYVVDKEALSSAGVVWNESLKRHQDYDFFLSIYYRTNGWFFSNIPAANVDWIEGGSKKKVNMMSMLRFLSIWEPRFPAKTLERYLSSQLLFCYHVKASDYYKNFYKRKIIALQGARLLACPAVVFFKIKLYVWLVSVLDLLRVKGFVRKLIVFVVRKPL